jgi:hypothetical protein
MGLSGLLSLWSVPQISRENAYISFGNPALFLTIWVTLDRSLNLSEPWFLHGDVKSVDLVISIILSSSDFCVLPPPLL